jgi:hypothetical protein
MFSQDKPSPRSRVAAVSSFAFPTATTAARTPIFLHLIGCFLLCLRILDRKARGDICVTHEVPEIVGRQLIPEFADPHELVRILGDGKGLRSICPGLVKGSFGFPLRLESLCQLE